MHLVAGFLVLLAGPAQADVYRFFGGQHPAGATSPALCTDQAEPWYPTIAGACQGLKSVLPACDRSSAIYRNYVATLSGPGLCSVSWEYANVDNPGSWYGYNGTWGVTTQVCPSNSSPNGSSCTCNTAYVTDPQNPSSCVPVVSSKVPNKPQAQDFCVANPIYPLTGAKKEFVGTGISVGGMGLTLAYDTMLKLPANQADTALALVEPNSFGALWKSSFHHKLAVSFDATRALLSRGDGKVLSFIGNGAGVFTTDADNTHKLVSIAGGYRFTDVATGDQETFDATGLLQSLVRGNSGMVLSFVYSGVNLTKVQSSDGRIVRFAYTNNLVSLITDTNGRTIVPAYDGNRNLVSLTWQDGKASQFLYENTSFPWAMTGKMDENNSRYATFTYDAQGRAIISEHAGGVDRYSVSYTQPPQLVVTDAYDPATRKLSRQHDWQIPGGTTLELPNGQNSSVAAASVMGMPSITSQSQPAGSGCAASTSAVSYDANGNIASKDDFTQMRSCYANDPGRNLPLVTVEGLPNTVDCASVLTTGASLPSGSRKVSTRWHPHWSLAARIEQPLKITTDIYHGQLDPFNGNVIANCTSALNLPNGKPLPVLCKRVEQATLDVDGASASPYDPYYDNVSLLLRGDGADGSTSFVDSSATPKAVTAGGDARVSTTQSKFGGSSMYFDGVRDYITVPPSPSLSMGASDFTIEMWIYKLGDNANASRLWNPDGDLYGDISLAIDAAGSLVSYGSSTGTSWNVWAFGTGIAIPNGVWKHLALVRSGGTVTLYVDGVGTVMTTSLGSAPLYDWGGSHIIGGQSTGADRPFNGYIDDFRVTKGLARYTGPFAVPTATYLGPAALDPAAQIKVSSFTYDASGRLLTSKDPSNRVTTYAYYGNSTDFSNPSISSDPGFDSVSLLLHGDDSDGAVAFTDSSADPKPVTTAGNTMISTTQSRFGGSSMYFDGARDYITVPSHPSLSMGASDFTIEMWIYKLADNPEASRLWNPDGDLYADANLGIDATGKLVSYGTSTGSSWNAWAFGTGVAIPNGVWKHVALVRSGDTVTLYVDGVGTVLTTTLGTTALYDGGYTHVIGGQGPGLDRAFNGYVDDFRVTKGLARYTANFTPPVQAFANTAPVIDPNATGHTAGDLQSITNAAGHVTQFTQYDRAGRVRQMVDPKGVVTDMAYTPRGWISSVTVTPPDDTATTTIYTYDNAGQMTGATLPDGTTLGYSYDAAHRLTGVTDAKGNTVTYTLDNAGNKTGEQVKDASNNLQRNITRVYDALNRIQQVTGASN